MNSERLQTSLDVERRENEVLRDRISNIAGEMDVKQNAYIEAKKIADSLAQDCSDFRHQAEAAEKEADGLRKALATAQTQNNAMKSELLGLHEDIRTFKSKSTTSQSSLILKTTLFAMRPAMSKSFVKFGQLRT